MLAATFVTLSEVNAQDSATGVSSQSSTVSQERLFHRSGDDNSPSEVQALAATHIEEILRAAGKKPVGADRWTSCTMDKSGSSRAYVAMFRDLNDDGRPEAVVRDTGIICNGMAGINSTVLSQTESGTWVILESTQGFVNFLVSRGADNFPDIEIGLPGVCAPYRRWDGSEYALVARMNAEGQPCKR